MSTHKTQFNDSEADEFLRSYFNSGDISAERVGGGEESQAFYFVFDENEYVLRVTRHEIRGYLKDQIAYKEFTSERVNVPEVIDVGKLDDTMSFIITRRAPGKTLDKFSKEEINKIKPSVIEALAAIHKINTSGEGYGGWGLNRNGRFETWNEYLLASLEQSGEEVEDKEFWNAELQRALKKEIKRLIPYCPEERALLHGDFGTPNMLSDGGALTAVIDWEDSKYGDPLDDMAALSLYPGDDFVGDFKEYYSKNGGVPAYFDERVLCYKLLRAFGGLWFYAYSDQKESYEKCAENARKLLE